jgi:hypothetical protein
MERYSDYLTKSGELKKGFKVIYYNGLFYISAKYGTVIKSTAFGNMSKDVPACIWEKAERLSKEHNLLF